MLRVGALVVTGEVPGEPLLTLALWIARGARDGIVRRSTERRLGPPRADRAYLTSRGELVIVSARAKPDWNEHVTIEAAGRLYRLRRVGELADGPHRALHYALAEQGPGDVIHGLVRYEGPLPPGFD